MDERRVQETKTGGIKLGENGEKEGEEKGRGRKMNVARGIVYTRMAG